MPSPITNIADVALEPHPAGKRAFPFHDHRVNEEMVFVLQGAGEIRIGDATCPLRAGDVVALPPDADGKPKRFVFVGRESESLGYWEGE